MSTTTDSPRVRADSVRVHGPRARAPRSVSLRIALMLAVGVHAVVFVFFRPSFVLQQLRDVPTTMVNVSAAGWREDLRTQADIADAEPLYLSTPRNYGHDIVSSVPRIEDELGGSLLGSFVPELSVQVGLPLPLDAPSEPGLSARNPELLPTAFPRSRWSDDANLFRLLPLNHWNAVATLGLRPQPGPNAPVPRQAWMRVEDMATGAVVVQRDGKPFEEEAPLGLPPAVSGGDWKPAAFSVLVDSQGVVGEAMPLPWIEGSTGTGNAAVDASVRTFLAAPAGLSRRLPPGHYRVILGP